MEHESISPELQEKAKACKTAEDILELAKDEGYELSDDELESISGGGWELPPPLRLALPDLRQVLPAQTILIAAKRRHAPPAERRARTSGRACGETARHS